MFGIISNGSIPNPAPVGLFETCENALVAAGFSPLVTRAPDGVHVSDVNTVMTVINTYIGSAAQVSYVKTQKQALLDGQFDQHFDLSNFIRGGTATGITAAQVGTFLATITNNYRSLRAAIANAANVATVTAIDISTGWPANP